MASANKALLSGSITFVVGVALWLSGLDEQVLIFTPTKLGVVLMVIGGLEGLYGGYLKMRGDS